MANFVCFRGNNLEYELPSKENNFHHDSSIDWGNNKESDSLHEDNHRNERKASDQNSQNFDKRKPKNSSSQRDEELFGTIFTIKPYRLRC